MKETEEERNRENRRLRSFYQLKRKEIQVKRGERKGSKRKAAAEGEGGGRRFRGKGKKRKIWN